MIFPQGNLAMVPYRRTGMSSVRTGLGLFINTVGGSSRDVHTEIQEQTMTDHAYTLLYCSQNPTLGIWRQRIRAWHDDQDLIIQLFSTGLGMFVECSQDRIKQVRLNRQDNWRVEAWQGIVHTRTFSPVRDLYNELRQGMTGDVHTCVQARTRHVQEEIRTL
jgi:hypothetical protein